MEYGVCFCDGDLLTPELMAQRFDLALQGEENMSGHSGRRRPAVCGAAVSSPVPAPGTSQEAEQLWELLNRFGRHTEGKRALARHLGVSLATLYRRPKATAA